MDLDLPDDFYVNKVLETDYNDRTLEYMRIHKELYPTMHKGEKKFAVLAQVKEMVRAELELEKYDRQIGNDFDSNAWVDRTRKSVRDAIFRYRSQLLLTPKEIIRHHGNTEESVGFIEALQKLPNAEFTA